MDTVIHPNFSVAHALHPNPSAHRDGPVTVGRKGTAITQWGLGGGEQKGILQEEPWG